MESKFENKCIYTYDYYLQLKRKTMDGGFVATCCCALVLFIAIAIACISNGWVFYSIIPFIAIVFVLYRLIGTPIRLASFAARKNRDIHGKDIETVVGFFDDHLLAVNKLSGGKTNIKYVDVLKLLETKDLIILQMEEGLSILLDKNGFTKGTKEDFVKFIKEVCINGEAKI